MGNFWTTIPIAGQAVDAAVNTGQGVYNLYKDLTNTDNQRSVAAQQQLQESAFHYNSTLMKDQYIYNRALQNMAQDFNANQARLQYERALIGSSAARDALNKRMAGINPAGSAGSAAASISSASTSPFSTGLASVGTPSASGGRYANSPTSFAEVQNLQASADKQRSEQKLTDLKALNQVARDSADVLKSKSEAYRNYKAGNLSHAEYQKTVALLDDLQNLYKSQADYYSKTGEANKSQAESAAITADANRMNALTAAARQAADQAYQRALTIIESDRVELQHRGIVIEEQKLQPIIDNIAADMEKKKAEAEKLHEEAILTSKDISNYEQKLESALVLQSAQADYYGYSGEAKQKEAKYYDYYVYHNTIAKPIIDALSSALFKAPVPAQRTFNINVKPQ